MKILEKIVLSAFVIALSAMAPDLAEAQGRGGGGGGGGGKGGPPSGGGGDPVDPTLPPTFNWMHPDVELAFTQGITGVGSHVTILDSFSGTAISGNLDGTSEWRYHGGWVSYTARLVAPGAEFTDLANPSGVEYGSDHITNHYAATSGVNVVNMSFGLFDPLDVVVDADYSLGTALWDSLVVEAHNPNGLAVFVKAAGNLNGQTVDAGTLNLGFPGEPHIDNLNTLLIGAENALFVGALEKNGTTKKKARIASYSTIAGDNTAVQDMFLVAGVDSRKTGLQGTSFAAPIVSGYAAMLGQKFGSATPDQIVDQLLLTARTDTISGYSRAVHGKGEACLSCALAPTAIPD